MNRKSIHFPRISPLACSLVVLLTGFAPVMHAVDNDPCYPVRNDRVLVYDAADLFSDREEEELETLLDGFALNSSNQFVVITTRDLCGYEIWQYATNIGELWGVGQSETDNGLIMVIKPKTPTASGEINISPGRGLHGVIPDGTSWLIEQNEMIPYFRNGDYPGGIRAGINVLMDLARGAYNTDEYAKQLEKKQTKFSWVIVVVILLVVAVFIRIRSRQVTTYARKNKLDWWTAWWLLSNTGRSHRGFWGDFSGGRGGFGGGGGGGGFGGFGGGSFGGGGSSSSW